MVITLQDMADVNEMERMRAAFLATVSHELRAPLTSIKGSAATALSSLSDLDPAVLRQFLRIIEDQADHMNELVTSLLDVARIETGTLAVSPEPAEVAVPVDQARSAFASSGGRKNLEINTGPDLPLVLADQRRIVQVLVNLLSNAARNSPDSSIIKVTAVREGVLVAISVADEGRGIPAEGMPHLFHKFSKVQSEEQRVATDLGLTICKGIVEAHGAASGHKVKGPAWVRASPSPYRQSKIRRDGRQSDFRRTRRSVPRRKWMGRYAYSRWTMTPSPSAMCETPWLHPDTHLY